MWKNWTFAFKNIIKLANRGLALPGTTFFKDKPIRTFYVSQRSFSSDLLRFWTNTWLSPICLASPKFCFESIKRPIFKPFCLEVLLRTPLSINLWTTMCSSSFSCTFSCCTCHSHTKGNSSIYTTACVICLWGGRLRQSILVRLILRERIPQSSWNLEVNMGPKHLCHALLQERVQMHSWTSFTWYCH